MGIESGPGERERSEGGCGYCGSNEHDDMDCPYLHERHGEKSDEELTEATKSNYEKFLDAERKLEAIMSQYHPERENFSDDSRIQEKWTEAEEKRNMLLKDGVSGQDYDSLKKNRAILHSEYGGTKQKLMDNGMRPWATEEPNELVRIKTKIEQIDKRLKNMIKEN